MKAAIALVIFAAAASAWAESKQDDDGKFHFVRDGRRDPFTFSLPAKVVEPVPIRSEDLDQLDQKEQNAHNLLTRAEDAVMDFRAADCIDACDHALAQLRHISDERPGVAALRQNLQSLRKAGDAMRARAEAAAAYQKLNVSVTGVVSRPRKAQAIVNGVVVREGQTLTAAGNETVLIEKISTDQVVVNFRGYRMAAPLAAAE